MKKVKKKDQININEKELDQLLNEVFLELEVGKSPYNAHALDFFANHAMKPHGLSKYFTRQRLDQFFLLLSFLIFVNSLIRYQLHPSNTILLKTPIPIVGPQAAKELPLVLKSETTAEAEKIKIVPATTSGPSEKTKAAPVRTVKKAVQRKNTKHPKDLQTVAFVKRDSTLSSSEESSKSVSLPESSHPADNKAVDSSGILKSTSVVPVKKVNRSSRTVARNARVAIPVKGKPEKRKKRVKGRRTGTFMMKGGRYRNSRH